MGDIADAMLDGTMCAHCGTYLDREPTGNIEFCDETCEREDKGVAKAHKEFKESLNQMVTVPKYMGMEENEDGKTAVFTLDLVELLSAQIRDLQEALEASTQFRMREVIEGVIYNCTEVLEAFKEHGIIEEDEDAKTS